MYESPITLIETQMRMAQENLIYQAVWEVGVDVNKEELIKALQYDRDQYDKGYKDGYEEAIKEFDEMLKAKAYTNNYCQEIVLADEINKLIKEMRRKYEREFYMGNKSTL